jgi:hypothetical protein
MESCVINISKDNCSLNEPVPFIKAVLSYIYCVANKLREWLIGKFLILRADVTFPHSRLVGWGGGGKTSSGAHSGALLGFISCIFGEWAMDTFFIVSCCKWKDVVLL